MNLNNWANIHSEKMTSHQLSWPIFEQGSVEFDQNLGKFVRQFKHCQWLSSCFPHFKNQQQTRDILAGGYQNWLVTKNDQCQLIFSDTSLGTQLQEPKINKSLSKKLPVPWMLDQLKNVVPESNTERTLETSLKRCARPGWYGGLSYPFQPQTVGIEQPLKNNADWPDALFGFARWVITLEHDTQSATMLTILEKDAPELQHILETWQQYLAYDSTHSTHSTKPEEKKPSLEIQQWQAKTSKEDYLTAFDQIKSAIDAGDVYQVNFTQCFETQFQGEPLVGFLHLKHHSPSPYAVYWSTPYGIVSCHSPELFIKTAVQSDANASKHTHAITKPIKGTCPRGKTPKEDSFFAQRLQASEKNRAENTMIVDLLRNDLSKTAIPGSMKVPKLCALESFVSIHHLVSEITCDIQPQFNAMDVIIHSFPGGSITGAPKRRAMEMINELEAMPRDIYCGAIGFWDHPQEVVFNIAIRTLLFHQTNKSVKIWAGGGIVKDSEAESEYDECFHKVRNLMQALINLS